MNESQSFYDILGNALIVFEKIRDELKAANEKIDVLNRRVKSLEKENEFVTGVSKELSKPTKEEWLKSINAYLPHTEQLLWYDIRFNQPGANGMYLVMITSDRGKFLRVIEYRDKDFLIGKEIGTLTHWTIVEGPN